MQRTQDALDILIVGAGPVACLAAIEMLRRGCTVQMVDGGPDIRTLDSASGHSFNLTLTYRGLASLDAAQRTAMYRNGVILTHRVIHQRDGEIVYQPYGWTDDQHLLSIPRQQLHRMLLQDAIDLGAQVRFGETCVQADVRRARATFLGSDMQASTARADFLFGCDGANSVVRHSMARYGARMQLLQEYIPHGHVELAINIPAEGADVLHHQHVEMEFGMHLWPRDDFFLQAQPNVDGGYTVALFMPLIDDGQSISFKYLPDKDAVPDFFQEQFPDIAPYLPDVIHDAYDSTPAQLRMTRCDPFHYKRSVLLGDAAHTMVPFYGQGINCSFEDIGVLASLFDNCRLRTPDRRAALARAIRKFSEIRVEPDHAITDLSLANLDELSSKSGKDTFQARKHIEVELSQRYPDDFRTLYEMVAFTRLPYHKIVRRDRLQERILDELCRRYEVDSDVDRIIEGYVASVRAARRGRRTGRTAGAPADAPATFASAAGQSAEAQLTSEATLRSLDDVLPSSASDAAPVVSPAPGS